MSIYKVEKDEYKFLETVEIYLEGDELIIRTGEDRLYPDIILTENDTGNIPSILLKSRGQNYKCNIGHPSKHGPKVKLMNKKGDKALSTRSLVFPKDDSEHVAILSIYSKADKRKVPYDGDDATSRHIDICRAFIADQIDVVKKVINREAPIEELLQSAKIFNSKSEKEKFAKIDTVVEER